MDIRLSARGCRSLQILLLCLTTLLPFSGVSAQAGDNIVITHPPAGAAIGNDPQASLLQKHRKPHGKQHKQPQRPLPGRKPRYR